MSGGGFTFLTQTGYTGIAALLTSIANFGVCCEFTTNFEGLAVDTSARPGFSTVVLAVAGGVVHHGFFLDHSGGTGLDDKTAWLIRMDGWGTV